MKSSDLEPVSPQEPTPERDWSAALGRVVADLPGDWGPVCVLDEIGSTQDAARRLGAAPGLIVTADRQTAGRGRRGRVWADTHRAGLAVSVVRPVRTSRGERLPIEMAVATARAVEAVVATRIGIKWPNDVVAWPRDDAGGLRKIAGVLIEQSAASVIIGIGVNVAQTSWPADLATRAVSLRQLGSSVDRLAMLCRLLREIAKVETLATPEVDRVFAEADVLRGRTVTCSGVGGTVTGVVLEVQPRRGLAVEIAPGRVTWMPAATTTVLAAGPRVDLGRSDAFPLS